MTRSTWLAIVWTVIILVACWTPRESLPIREGGPSLLRYLHVDKVVHFGMFAVFSVAWRNAASRRASTPIAIAGILLAIVTELVQSTPIVGRDGDVWDALADALGVVGGLAFMEFVVERRRPATQRGA